MSLEVIGKQIAALRKEKGIKQEELAKAVGVSVQAVSKWENGGVPDIELIPKIADYFGVSIDYIFKRSIADYADLSYVLGKKINSATQKERLKLMLNYCFVMERAAMIDPDDDGSVSVEEYEDKLDDNDQRYSSLQYDNGFTLMGIANRSQYFLLVPDAKDADKAYFDGIDYTELFRDFSDKDTFSACVFFHKRSSGIDNKSFTESLLVKNIGVTKEKAVEIINIFKKYSMIRESEIELDDEIKTVYTFVPTPSFVALLIFAHQVIKKPNSFSYYYEGRNAPYLK